MAIAGGITSDVLNERVLDTLFGFHARSENVPLPTETVTAPVDTDGVTVKVYPVELV